jgi:hypothetical protein
MIRKSAKRFFPRDKRGTRLRGDHAQTINGAADSLSGKIRNRDKHREAERGCDQKGRQFHRCVLSSWPWTHLPNTVYLVDSTLFRYANTARKTGLENAIRDAGLMPTSSVQRTCVAPGILRRALVAAQLKITVSTKAMRALAIAGMSKSNSQYCSQSTMG